MNKFIFGEAMDYVKLGDLCVINSGGTPRRNNESYWKNGDIPWVKIGDLNNGIVESTEEFITLDGLKNSSAKIFPSGTLLYTIFATIGEVAILNIDAATNQAIVGLQLKENQKVYLKYIYYYLKSQTNIIKQLGRGVAQNNINLSVVKDMIIHIVSLEKQSNIIATLSKLEKIKENRIIILNYLDGLIKSRFVDLFGDIELNEKKWKKIRFGELINSANNGLARRGNDQDGNIVLRLIELQENFINYSGPNRILLTDDEKKRYRLLEGDLLFARVNGNPKNVGRCATFYECEEQVYHNDHIIRTSCDKSQLDSVFAAYLFNSEYGKNRISKKIKTSAGQYTINQEGLKSIEIILPPIGIQYSFAKLVKQINKLKSDVQKSIDETQLLMDSLMQEYFG